MTQPFGHVDAPTLIGSWPVVPSFSGGIASVLPKTLLSRATILASRKETSSGFDVATKGMLIFIDGVQKNIAFVGATTLSLGDVIFQINAAVAPDPPIAFQDNGFLRLESPTIGEGSTLRLETDTNPEVFVELGMFSGVESKAGDFSQAAHVDPDRQVALHGQLTMMEGEDLEARVVNRVAAQLAINSDLQYGILNRKRVAKVTKGSAVNPSNGFILPGNIYTGPDAVPTEDQLEGVVSLLDSEGNELYRKEVVTRDVATLTFIVDPDAGVQAVAASSPIFFSTDPANEFYVQVTDGGMGTLSGLNLKITGYLNSSEVLVRNVDAEGKEVPITGVFSGGLRNEVVKGHVKVTGLWTDAGMTQRVEQYAAPKLSAVVIDSVSKNNRVVCTTVGFDTAVAVGDVVEISGHSLSYPYTNNGTYRVSKVVDDKTLELVTDEYGPAILNPGGSLGSLDVSTDGDFWVNPYVSLNDTVPAGTYPMVYKVQSNLKDITDDPDALSGSLTEHAQEVDSTVLSTLSAIIGPSANLDEYLYDDRRFNLEDIYFQFQEEHYQHDELNLTGYLNPGRHRNIRPDRIDMFWDVPGETVTVRGKIGEGLGDTKLAYRDHSEEIRWEVQADGSMFLREGQSVNDSWIGAYAELDDHTQLNLWNLHGVDGGWAHFQAYGAGVLGRAALTLSGAHAYPNTELRGGDGTAMVHFIGDRDHAEPPHFSINLRPRAGVGRDSLASLLKLDVVNDGYGGEVNSAWSITGDGYVGIGSYDPYELLRLGANLHYHDSSASNAWLYNAYVDGSSDYRRLSAGKYVAIQDFDPLVGEYRLQFAPAGAEGSLVTPQTKIFYEPLYDTISIGTEASSGTSVSVILGGGDTLVRDGNLQVVDGDYTIHGNGAYRSYSNSYHTWFLGGTSPALGAALKLTGIYEAPSGNSDAFMLADKFEIQGGGHWLGGFYAPSKYTSVSGGSSSLRVAGSMEIWASGLDPADVPWPVLGQPAGGAYIALTGDEEGKYVLAIQDGAGRVNEYWNAYWNSVDNEHQVIKGGEHTYRRHWGGGSMSWEYFNAALAAPGDPITWDVLATLTVDGDFYAGRHVYADHFLLNNAGGFGRHYLEPSLVEIYNGSVDQAIAMLTIATTANPDGQVRLGFAGTGLPWYGLRILQRPSATTMVTSYDSYIRASSVACLSGFRVPTTPEEMLMRGQHNVVTATGVILGTGVAASVSNFNVDESPTYTYRVAQGVYRVGLEQGVDNSASLVGTGNGAEYRVISVVRVNATTLDVRVFDKNGNPIDANTTRGFSIIVVGQPNPYASLVV